MDTLVKDNVNPIEKMEKSLAVVAETIHAGKKREEMMII
jgi:hypothetical protein